MEELHPSHGISQAWLAFPAATTVQSGQRSRDEHAQHLKEWLDIAQEELMDTQSRLQDRESECRRLTTQLAQLSAARAEAGEVQGSLLSLLSLLLK